MTNHFHLVLRSRPDVVALWDDSQVARRWLMLCPKRRDANRHPEEPNEFELNSIRNDPARLKEIRSRLSDVSFGACCHTAGDRASDKGFLPMSVADYLELLEWTARQIRADKRGATPATASRIFERLGIDAEVWCELTRDFGRLFGTVAGKPKVIESTWSQTCLGSLSFVACRRH